MNRMHYEPVRVVFSPVRYRLGLLFESVPSNANNRLNEKNYRVVVPLLYAFPRRKPDMKFGWAVLLLLVGFAIPRASQAQVSIYAEGTASNLPDGPAGDYLYGGTVGLLYDGPSIIKGHAVISADIQTRLVDKSGERLAGAVVGPRVTFPLKKLRVSPFVSFMVGFARYRDGTLPGALNTTDNEWQTNGGLSHQITPHFDVVADFGYAQYGAEDGKYNPLSYSAGVIFHFVKH